MTLSLPCTKVIYKLPEILSVTEVQSLLNAVGNIKHKTLLVLMYATGLRVSEAVKLRLSDIDSDRMTLHIRNCKNRKERYVILSPVVHKLLQKYWRHCRFTDYVFPGSKPNTPMATGTASQIYKRAKAQAQITKAGGIHGLRHAFATHMLEAGENLFTIQKLLGHSSIQSTVRYLQFIPDKDTKIKSPVETFDLSA